MKIIPLKQWVFLTPLMLLALGQQAWSTTTEVLQKEVKAIQQRIATTYDKPDAKVRTQPVIVEGNYAMANWLQDSRGGRALLQKNKQGQWEIMACGGDGFKNPQVLQQAGLPTATAQALIQQLQAAEKTVPAKTLQTIGAFDAHAQHHGQPEHPKTQH